MLGDSEMVIRDGVYKEGGGRGVGRRPWGGKGQRQGRKGATERMRDEEGEERQMGMCHIKCYFMHAEEE